MAAIIEASGVVKRFGKTVALDGLDLTAEQGVILAVLGPNGAGKTTFVRAIATLIKPDAGPPGLLRAGLNWGAADGPEADRSRRTVRRRRASDDRPREPRDGRP